MSVTVTIIDGPLLPANRPGAAARPEPAPGAGAWVVFEGLVRAQEHGQVIDALHYQVYEPMAQRQLEALCHDLINRHGLLAIHVMHSRGRVPVGACSFRLWIAAAHRKPALAAMDEFIDRLKRDVPIWKVDAAP